MRGVRLIRQAAVVCALLVGTSTAAQFGDVSGPVLGALWIAAQGQIRPLRGIPGSATLGEPVDLGFVPAHAVTLGGAHVLVANGDAGLSVVNLALVPPAVRPVAYQGGVPARSASSRHGTAAALHDPSRDRVVIVTGLPASPVAAHEVALSSGGVVVTHLAVSDDGRLLVYAVAHGDAAAVYVWSMHTGNRYLTHAAGVSAIALTPTGDVIVADPVAHEVFVVQQPAGGGRLQRLAHAGHGVTVPVGVAVSDGGRVHVANAGSGTVLTFEPTGALVGVQSCDCDITGLNQVREGIYRLTERPDRTLYLLETHTGDRLFFVPPAAP